MNIHDLIKKIVSKKILLFNDINTQESEQYFHLIKILNKICSYKTNSVYFKCYGQYFYYISDNNSFYYVGNKRMNKNFIVIY